MIFLFSGTPARPSQCSCYNQNSLHTSRKNNTLIRIEFPLLGETVGETYTSPVARLDPTFSGLSSNSSLPSRVNPSRPSRLFSSNGQAQSFGTPFDYNNFISDCPSCASPTTSSSLSPPATENSTLV